MPQRVLDSIVLHRDLEPQNAVDIATFIERNIKTISGDSLCYMLDRNGAPVKHVKFVENTLTDGSKTYDFVLTMEE
jgi:hypothetical protein